MKRVFIVHGWDGHPEEGWFPWLNKELSARGFAVFVPQLPEANEPRIGNWVPKLSEEVGVPDPETYFVGHSMGCQTIARYIATLSDDVKIGGVVFVAGFFKRLTNLDDDAVTQSVSKEWLTTSLDLRKVKAHMKESVALFSDDDPYVPMDNKEDFLEKLGSNIVVEHKRGHFSGESGVKELPSVLDALLKIAGEKS